MTSSLDSLNQPLARCVGWALLHFLWQGLVLGVAWAALRYALRRQRPNLRYAAGCLVLLLMLAAPILTCSILLERVPTATPSSGLSATAPGPVQFASGSTGGSWVPSLPAPLIDRLTVALEMALPWLVGFWGIGVCVLSGRLVRGGWSVHRLGLLQTTPFTGDWIERLQRLQHRMHVSRPVRLVQSALVEVPTLAGWFRPVILLPASTLTGLSVAQLELILAHELAHIRRWDLWVNLAQVLVETVLFYHPAVWWVSRCVREERELCCDDLALRACGDRLAYARALTRLETLRGPATAAALAVSGGSLIQRIRHVLGRPVSAGVTDWRRTAGTGLVGLGAVVFMVGVVSLALSPKQYEARARIVVSRSTDSTSTLSGSGEGAYDPYFLQTQIVLVHNRALLTEVVQWLGLAQRWGDREGAGRPWSTEQAVSWLASALDVRQIRNTSLIEIRLRDEVAEDAAAIANALAEAYRDQRLSFVRSAADQGVEALRKELDQQNASVRQLMERADQLRRELNLRDSNDNPGPSLNPEAIRRLEAERMSVTSEIDGLVALRDQLREVRSRDGSDRLAKVMLNACPDQNLSRLLQDLGTTESTLVKETQAYAPDHPNIKALQAMRKEQARQVDECTEGLLAGLEVKVEGKRAQRDSLAKQMEEAKTRDAESSERYGFYFRVREDIENQQKIRDAILLSVLNETVNASIPIASLVEIVDRAEPPRVGYYPGHRLGLSLCSLGLLSSLLGFGLRLTARPAVPSPGSA